MYYWYSEQIFFNLDGFSIQDILNSENVTEICGILVERHFSVSEPLILWFAIQWSAMLDHYNSNSGYFNMNFISTAQSDIGNMDNLLSLQPRKNSVTNYLDN